VLAADERRLEQVLELELARLQPHTALIREVAISQRQARELVETERLRAWAEQERLGRTPASRQECVEFNALMRSWFSDISIDVRAQTVVLAATRRSGAGAPRPPTQLCIERAAWMRSSARASLGVARYVEWEKAEIIGALQGWADVNGRSPAARDWQHGGLGHPCRQTVVRKLGSWERALSKASLAPLAPTPRHDHWGATS
jgi:hypothetical protein